MWDKIKKIVSGGQEFIVNFIVEVIFKFLGKNEEEKQKSKMSEVQALQEEYKKLEVLKKSMPAGKEALWQHIIPGSQAKLTPTEERAEAQIDQRTKEVQKREFWRFAQAYATAFNKSWGSSEEEAFSFWTKMMKSRLSKQLYPMDIESHPEFIKEKIKNMKPEEFGFNNWKGE